MYLMLWKCSVFRVNWITFPVFFTGCCTWSKSEALREQSCCGRFFEKIWDSKDEKVSPRRENIVFFFYFFNFTRTLSSLKELDPFINLLSLIKEDREVCAALSDLSGPPVAIVDGRESRAQIQPPSHVSFLLHVHVCV